MSKDKGHAMHRALDIKRFCNHINTKSDDWAEFWKEKSSMRYTTKLVSTLWIQKQASRATF